MFWVAILYFSEGFPLGVFYDLFPVYFRQQGVALWKIGFMSLLGLAWTLKFLWAPAIDHFRRHRHWMLAADLLMAFVLSLFAFKSGFGPWVWLAIGAFTLLSATNDIAIDGYTIEFLDKGELGLANGLRIGFYRVGMLASGFILILSDAISWPGAYLSAAALLSFSGLFCRRAPEERAVSAEKTSTVSGELRALFNSPPALGTVLFFFLGVLWLVNRAAKWSSRLTYFWPFALGCALLIFAWRLWVGFRGGGIRSIEKCPSITEGPMFGTLMQMLRRPYFVPVILFILTFKLADSAMGFMIKPFWVDAGFSASEIGLVSVNIGLLLSIGGGVIGGWITDKTSIFQALWLLGLFQAVSNLGYAFAAAVLPVGAESVLLPFQYKALIYSASAIESFTGGLGTAAFLAFLMAIVNKRHAATEYALLSSVFALSRSLAGWLGGFGAESMGYAPYFLLTFFLAFPAYGLLPWVRKMLHYAAAQDGWGQA